MDIPKRWEIQNLSKISSIKRGAGSQYLNYVDDSENGIRLIRIGDFLGDNKKFVQYTEDMERFILQKGDLLIAGTGATAGITFEVPDSFMGYAFSYNAPRIRPYIDQNKKYIIYALKSQFILRQQHALFTGNAQPFLDTKAIGGFRILLPPPSEQKKIAEILSTWDRAIEVVERLIENSQAQKKALMQQLLTGKKRLPGFDGAWEHFLISEFGRIVTGNTPPKNVPENYGDHILWATAQDFKNKYISSTILNLSMRGEKYARVVPKGSILVTCIASIGLNAIAGKDLATNQQINSIIVHNDHSNEFIYYLVQNNKHELRKRAGITAVPIVNKSVFGNIKLKSPASKKEQSAIAAILSNADREIELLTQQLIHLKSEKSALMQQLLTGKRRVKIDGEAAA